MAWREQAVTVSVESEGIVLEGLWQSGAGRSAVIAPPHPEYGGSIDNPVVNEIAFALYHAGYASLRFNWRGVGASQGRMTGDWGAAEVDYRAAIDHIEATISSPILGAGYSFGAATALRVALHDSRVRGLLLVAPPISMIKKLPIDSFPGPLRVIVGASDEFAPIEDLSELLSPLANARLEVIHCADHFFSSGGLAELQQLARASVA